MLLRETSILWKASPPIPGSENFIHFLLEIGSSQFLLLQLLLQGVDICLLSELPQLLLCEQYIKKKQFNGMIEGLRRLLLTSLESFSKLEVLEMSNICDTKGQLVVVAK